MNRNREEIEDHTLSSHHHDHAIPVDIQKILEKKEHIFDAPDPDSQVQNTRDYFPTHNIDLSKLNFNINEDEEDDDEEENEDEDEEREDWIFEKRGEKMLDLTDGRGFVKKKLVTGGILSKGSVSKGCAVTVHYSLYLEGHQDPFDSTLLRGRKERFKLDDGNLIPGLEIGIKSMMVQESAEFLIHPDYAFGDIGCPPRIPEKSWVYAEVELFDFVEEGIAENFLSSNEDERRDNFTFLEVVDAVEKELKNGSKFFEKEEYASAARHYDTGIRAMETVVLANDQEEEKQKKLLLKLNNNIGICYLKLGKHAKACTYLQNVLQEDPKNTKALYRMGKAKLAFGHIDQAKKYLRKALNLDPNDVKIKAELNHVESEEKRRNKIHKVMCQKMFNGKETSSNILPQINTDNLTPAQRTLYKQLLLFKNEDPMKNMDINMEITQEQFNDYERIATLVGLKLEKKDPSLPFTERQPYIFYK